MSESKKRDGIRQYRIAGPKGYAAVITIITVLFGGDFVDMAIQISGTDVDDMVERIDELERTVNLMEHGIVNAKMCMSDMKVVVVEEDDEFELWP